MSVNKARSLDLVDYLSELGYQPQKISGNNYWYLSPFREEQTPSFKINRVMNRWYDFAEGKGGNLVDFGIVYHRCSVKDFLQKLETTNITGTQNISQKIPADISGNPLTITGIHLISSASLIHYLETRKIPYSLASEYLREASYTLKEKTWYALAFKNDLGGYELRNRHIKMSSSPKAITRINQNAETLCVFEGFFDFLSYLSTEKNHNTQSDFLILNSTAFFEQTLPIMQSYKEVQLWLDNDATGERLTQKALTIDPIKFKDQSILYEKYNDINDHLCRRPMIQQQKLSTPGLKP